MKNYFKLALKVLRRRKFFTFISLFGISLTLVVLMVATAALDNFFSPRAPESRFDRVLVVYRLAQRGPNATQSTEPGFRFIQDYVRTLSDVEAVAAFSNAREISVYKGTGRIDLTLKRTDGDYWRVLNFHFLEGRPYSSQEDWIGAPVAVITSKMRDKLFGGGPASGKTFELDGKTFRVVGVVPPVSLTRIAAFADVWVPIGTLPTSEYRSRLMGGFNAIVLAHSRSDFPRLRREFATNMLSFPIDRKEFTEVQVGLDTPFEAFARVLTWNRQGDRASFIIETIFALIAILFMALPALNLVTLNLSRILERASEIGVRKAFGAPRRSLVWQFVVENVVLTMIGGVIGFAISVIVMAAITRAEVIPNAQFVINVRVFFYGMVIAVVFGLLSGVYPAWRMSRLDPVNALRGGVA